MTVIETESGLSINLNEFAAMGEREMIAMDPNTREAYLTELTLRTQRGERFDPQVHINAMRLMHIDRTTKMAENPRARKATRKAEEEKLSLGDFDFG